MGLPGSSLPGVFVLYSYRYLNVLFNGSHLGWPPVDLATLFFNSVFPPSKHKKSKNWAEGKSTDS